ncbi:MAG: hypothetical protein WDM81_15200 [Rhizomicrobium sp.]
MSVAHQKFPESLARTLMTRGGVALGPIMPEDTGNLFLWTNDIEAAGMDLPYRPTDGIAFANWLAGMASRPDARAVRDPAWRDVSRRSAR